VLQREHPDTGGRDAGHAGNAQSDEERALALLAPLLAVGQ
jgi:hypothetical protein